MEVIILAGGLGTRLNKVVSDVPKCMAPIGGQPFLHYILSYLKRYSVVKKVILLLGYKHEHVTQWVKFQKLPFDVEFFIEQSPLGTGGAIKKGFGMIEGVNALVMNGDTYFDINIDLFIEQHNTVESQLSIALKPLIDFSRYGNVLTNNEKIITNFEEKKYCKNGLINGGVYLVNKNFDAFIYTPEKFSFEDEILQKQYISNKFYGFIHDNYFIDIGVPEDYNKANLEFSTLFNDTI